jgi:hypothetical protein
MAASEDYSFIKAYFELMKLREDVECIERSRSAASRRAVAGRKSAVRGDGDRGSLRT